MPRSTRSASVAVAAASLVVALASTLYAGRGQPSLVLILLFLAWVAAPFAATIWANTRATRWPARVRPALAWAGAIVSAASAIFYACDAFGLVPLKTGFVFLVGPVASWAAMILAVGVASVAGREPARG